MIKRLVVCLFLALSAIVSGTALADQKFEVGIDRPGNDYDRQLFPSNYNQITCQNLCEQAGKCVSWTYVKPGVQDPKGVCYLKNVLSPSTPNDCCISGVVQLPFYVGVDLPGADYDSTVSPAQSAQTCQKKCQNDGRCNAWTFDHSNNTCWLKSDAPDAFPNPCCSSGVIPPRLN